MCRRIRKFFRICLILLLLMIASGLAVFAVASAPIWGDALLRIDVVEKGGDQVHVSIPLSLLHSSFKVMPKKIRRLCKDLELSPDMITNELKVMAGEDIVHVKDGNESVRIYIEPLFKDHVMAQGFLYVHVKESGWDGHEFSVWIPRGFISMAAGLVRVTGVVDRYVELPPEIENLKIIKHRSVD